MKQYQTPNPFFWMLIAGFVLFWLLYWADGRPTPLTPRGRHATAHRR